MWLVSNGMVGGLDPGLTVGPTIVTVLAAVIHAAVAGLCFEFVARAPLRM